MLLLLQLKKYLSSIGWKCSVSYFHKLARLDPRRSQLLNLLLNRTNLFRKVFQKWLRSEIPWNNKMGGPICWTTSHKSKRGKKLPKMTQNNVVESLSLQKKCWNRGVREGGFLMLPNFLFSAAEWEKCMLKFKPLNKKWCRSFEKITSWSYVSECWHSYLKFHPSKERKGNHTIIGRSCETLMFRI